MINIASSSRRASSETVRPNGDKRAFQAASLLKKRWRTGEAPDAVQALADEPALRNYPTLVIELAYEEFRLRLAAGECLTVDEFAERFPGMERSLCMYFAVQSLLGSNNPLVSPPAEELWPTLGDTFLGFDILSELGRGTFGRVYLASERLLGNRRVALKVAWQGGQEAAILGRLRHPNIVPIHSIQEDEATGLTAFCMPLLGRATLSTVIDRLFSHQQLPRDGSAILRAAEISNQGLDLPAAAALPDAVFRRGTYIEAAVHLVSQLADALSHAHSRGIYHRDLKPSNILMSPEGSPLLLDFNLSVDETLPLGRLGGTLPYMAPEELDSLCDSAAKDATRHFDPRSDLFSLGVILYELLTGKLPFGSLPNGPSVQETVKVLKERQIVGPPAVDDVNPQVDRRLAALVNRVLAVDPDERLVDAKQFSEALCKELRFLPRARRRIVRHWRVTLAGATIAVAIFAAVGSYLALRPSYAVRMYNSGVAHLEARDYTAAVNDLTESLNADPKSDDAYFARGRALKNRGDFAAAIADFGKINDRKGRPLLIAAEAYCKSQVNENSWAAVACEKFLEAEKRSAIVWNNLGSTYIRLAEYKKAEKCLEQAVAIDDTLQPPHFNLVFLYVIRDHDATAMPAQAFVHAQRALAIGPESAELDGKVATLYAMVARRDKKCIEPAFRYLGRAIALGASPQIFLSDSVFADFLTSSGFQTALHTAPISGPLGAKARRLLDPLP